MTSQSAARVDAEALPSVKDDHEEIMRGLSAAQKTINPKYFYDHLGSQLFEEITTLPEYYPTRTEISILREHAQSIAAILGGNIYVVEPGAGNCEKIRYLLDAIKPRCYLPVDISLEFLQQSVNQLVTDFDWLHVHPIAADFSQDFELPEFTQQGRVVVFYPGSTIGNFDPDHAVEFLKRIAKWVAPHGGVLLGVDLQKDINVLHAAYNDSKGVTEKFNLNILSNLNSILDGDFDLNNFNHRAYYNTDKNRIEMHLVATRDHRVNLDGNLVSFKQGESIHTENSYKYTLQGLADLASQAGLSLKHSWCDDEQLFSMNYLVVV